MADVNTFKQPHIFLKVVEIVLLIVVISTFFANFMGWAFFVTSIILGCFINVLILLGMYLVGYTQIRQTPLELILYAYYTLGLFVSSILLMATGLTPSLITCGVFCLLLSVVYSADIYFAFIEISSRPLSFPPSNSPPAPEVTAPNYPPYPPSTQANVVDTGVTVMAPPPYETSTIYPGV